MKKNLAKVFASASIVVALILIMILLVTVFGGIDQKDFDSHLVKGLFITLSVLYVILDVITLVLLFVNTDVIKDVTVHVDRGSLLRVSVKVITKLVKDVCHDVEGVKCKRVAVSADDYSVRLRVNVRVVDKDVVEVETYLRTLIEDLFNKEFGFRFNTIEFRVMELTPKYKAEQEEIEAIVAGRLAARKKAAIEKELEADKREDEKLDAEEAEHEIVALPEEVEEAPISKETEKEAIEDSAHEEREEEATEGVEEATEEPKDEPAPETTEAPEAREEHEAVVEEKSVEEEPIEEEPIEEKPAREEGVEAVEEAEGTEVLEQEEQAGIELENADELENEPADELENAPVEEYENADEPSNEFYEERAEEPVEEPSSEPAEEEEVEETAKEQNAVEDEAYFMPEEDEIAPVEDIARKDEE